MPRIVARPGFRLQLGQELGHPDWTVRLGCPFGRAQETRAGVAGSEQWQARETGADGGGWMDEVGGGLFHRTI